MTDQQVLALAIQASKLSARRFAMEVLAVDERSLRYWLRGDRTMLGTVRVVAKGIILRPSLAEELILAHEAVLKEG